MKETEVKETNNKLEVRYIENKKLLTITVKDPCWKTPFQSMLVADILTALYGLMSPWKNVKFEMFNDEKTSIWGFRAIPKE
jgi:hypothetical protein